MRILCMEDICKSFDNQQVLKNITLNIDESEIFGLLGPSGAGKTTLVKILTGLLPMTSGSSTIFGKKIGETSNSLFSLFGMVLDNDGLYDRLSCYDNLELYAKLYSIKNRHGVIMDLLEQVGLLESCKKSVSTLSKGMRQRLSFARAILHSPKLVFLDEPTSGLDPATTLQIHSMMTSLKENGTTFFLTTHNMNEAQQMCDHLALLNNGIIIEEGTPSEICLRHRKECIITIDMSDGKHFVTDSIHLESVLRDTVKSGNTILKIHSNEPNLENVFIELTGRDLK